MQNSIRLYTDSLQSDVNNTKTMLPTSMFMDPLQSIDGDGYFDGTMHEDHKCWKKQCIASKYVQIEERGL
jgi:hypothetical protein